MTDNPRIRLIITDSELKDGHIIIKEMQMLDNLTGKFIKAAKLIEELHDFLKLLEISLDDYYYVMEMQKKNPAFTKLCENFKLYK